ncbi:MAG TPA: hypothetical protein VI382_04100, partial [Candidatus Manganitrophaceae bacterium]|nr:hypothetical protein [Candidatus Manganitrophaceae bacterium]
MRNRKGNIIGNIGRSFLMVFMASTVAMAQGTTTLTTSATSTTLTDNPTFGCEACRALPDHNPETIFPTTNTPIFSGDPRAAELPATVGKALPPNNQFGVGVPSGDSGTGLSSSIPFALSEPDLNISSDNRMESTPVAGGGKS